MGACLFAKPNRLWMPDRFLLPKQLYPINHFESRWRHSEWTFHHLTGKLLLSEFKLELELEEEEALHFLLWPLLVCVNLINDSLVPVAGQTGSSN